MPSLKSLLQKIAEAEEALVSESRGMEPLARFRALCCRPSLARL